MVVRKLHLFFREEGKQGKNGQEEHENFKGVSHGLFETAVLTLAWKHRVNSQKLSAGLDGTAAPLKYKSKAFLPHRPVRCLFLMLTDESYF
jgi:hypothetical protein